MAKNIQHIGIIGSGNVAWHLGHGLKSEGFSIDWIFSRNSATAQELANFLSCKVVTDLVNVKVDLCLICTTDDAVQELLNQLHESCSVAYTSGTKTLDSLNFSGQNLGVFYPLQTFSKEQKLNLFEIPFFIESKDSRFAQDLFDVAWKLSRKVQFANSEERKKLHLTAVMVNNFTNHLATLAKDFLDKNKLSFEHLKPLMTETVRKLDKMSPYEAQTGPARRKDETTLKSHLEMLEGDQKLLYELFTKSIQKTYSTE